MCLLLLRSMLFKLDKTMKLAHSLMNLWMIPELLQAERRTLRRQRMKLHVLLEEITKKLCIVVACSIFITVY